MSDSVKLVVAVVAAVLVMALIAYARGTAHHHGLDVGSQGRSVQVAAALAPRHR